MDDAQVWIEWKYRIDGYDAPYIVRFPVPQTVAGVEAVADAMASSVVKRTFPETPFTLIDRRELTPEEAMG